MAAQRPGFVKGLLLLGRWRIPLLSVNPENLYKFKSTMERGLSNLERVSISCSVGRFRRNNRNNSRRIRFRSSAPGVISSSSSSSSQIRPAVVNQIVGQFHWVGCQRVQLPKMLVFCSKIPSSLQFPVEFPCRRRADGRRLGGRRVSPAGYPPPLPPLLVLPAHLLKHVDPLASSAVLPHLLPVVGRERRGHVEDLLPMGLDSLGDGAQ